MLTSSGLNNFIRGFGIINDAAHIIIRQIQNKESWRETYIQGRGGGGVGGLITSCIFGLQGIDGQGSITDGGL